MENGKKKWLSFRRGKKKGDENETASIAALTDATSSRVRKSSSLFRRNNKKIVVTTAPKPATSQSSNILPSRPVAREKQGNREVPKRQELGTIQFKNVPHSMDTTRDSVSMEEPGEGSVTDARSPPVTPVRKEKNVNERALAESTLGGVTLEDIHRLSTVRLYEASSEVNSEAATLQAVGSPPRPRSNVSANAKSTTTNTNTHTVTHRNMIEEDAGSIENDPHMPKEVNLQVRECPTNEELTVFSEESMDRELGISTPPAMKRNRHRMAQTDALVVGVRTSDAKHSPNHPPPPQKPPLKEKDRTLRKLELESLKRQLEEEKSRIKERLDWENARLAEAMAADKTIPIAEVAEDPVEPCQSTTNVPSQGGQVESRHAPEMGDETVKAAEPRSEGPLRGCVPRSHSTDALTRTHVPKQSNHPEITQQGPISAYQALTRNYSNESVLMVEEGFERPLLQRTTSHGSVGLEKGSQLSKPSSVLSRSPNIPTPTPVSAGQRKKVKSDDEDDKDRLSRERRRVEARKARRQKRAERQSPPKRATPQPERDLKVRVVEDNEVNAKEGVEVEHMAFVEDEDHDVRTSGGTSAWAGGTKSWVGSGRSKPTTNYESDSHCESDPDPFSGIDEQRIASLTLALQNARQAVSRASDTETLVNETTAAKRSGRVRFQRKPFFKGLARTGKDKKKDPPGRAAPPNQESAKVIRKGKLAPPETPLTARKTVTTAKRVAMKKPSPKVARKKTPKEPTGDSPAMITANSCGEIVPTNQSHTTAAADSDIETNMLDNSRGILGQVNVIPRERPAIVSDDEDDYSASESSSEDEMHSSESMSSFSGDVSVPDGFTVATFVHDYPILVNFARTLSRTVNSVTNFAGTLPATEKDVEEANIKQIETEEEENEGQLEDAVILSRSFSFSDGRKHEDDVSISSGEDSECSDDVLAVRNRFACML